MNQQIEREKRFKKAMCYVYLFSDNAIANNIDIKEAETNIFHAPLKEAVDWFEKSMTGNRVTCEKIKSVPYFRRSFVLMCEIICRNINDEYIYWSLWATYGVGDGEIDWTESTPSDIDDYYIEDEVFQSLISLFNQCVQLAINHGGFCHEP